MSNKGIIVKIKNSHCIILTNDGTYHKIHRSRVSNPTVGAESEFFPVNWSNRLKPLLLVACLLIAFVSLNFYRANALADPAAYVALDINPSLELGVDKNSKVVSVQALNQDAEILLKEVDIKGKDLYLAVRQILGEAAASGYIKPEETNYILSTVTPVETSIDVIDYDKMTDNLQDSIENEDLDVSFVVLSADSTTRQEAMNKGISVGKLLVYKNSINSGKKLSLEEVKQNSVTTLVRNHKVLLLPGNKKGYVKLIRVPRKNGHLKKQSSAPNGDNSTVNSDLNKSIKQTDGKQTPPRSNDIVKSKSGKKEKTKQEHLFLRKLRNLLNLDVQNKTIFPNQDSGSMDKKSEKQGGKNKSSRPANPVEESDTESQNTTNSDNTHEKNKDSETKASSPEKKKNNAEDSSTQNSSKKGDNSAKSSR